MKLPTSLIQPIEPLRKKNSVWNCARETDERKLIKKIDSTAELIDIHDYGYCEACGVDIGIKRLEARPTATQCIDCKTLAEIKEKQEMG